MLTQSYFPNTEGDRVVWLTNFDTKIQIHATALALNPVELATTLTDIDFYVWVLQTWYPSIQQSALESTAYKLLIAWSLSYNFKPTTKRVSLYNDSLFIFFDLHINMH